MNSKLYGVGVGPGNPELLTLEAVKTIKESKVIVLPSKNKEKCVAFEIAKKAVPEIEEKKLLFCDFPMTKDKAVLKKAQKETADKIIGELKNQNQVAFLTIGDAVVYSTYMYVHRLVVKKGYEAKIVNGITSFSASAAHLGISLADQDEEIHIIPASYCLEKSFEKRGTLIFMKSGKKLSELKNFLKTKKESYDFDFYAVSNCGFEDEKLCYNLEDFDYESGYLTIVIVRNIKSKTSEKNYSFFQNRVCEMFPCHKNVDEDEFNCLFCYCPLYCLGEKCGGNFKINEKGIKSCIDCNFPHHRSNYKLVNEKIKKLLLNPKTE